jgi:homoserine dehydrogenase
MTTRPPLRIALAGLGNVGASVLSILHTQREALRKRYGLTFAVTGVVELGGGAIDPGGLDLACLLQTLAAKRPVADLPNVGRPGLQGIDLVTQAEPHFLPHFLLDATPVNIVDGQPSLDMVTAALRQNVHVVMANKGPLAVAYGALQAISDLGLGWGHDFQARSASEPYTPPRPQLRFSACVGGALPTINLGWRDLAGCTISRVEAVFNGTTQSILRAMETGQSYADALLDAQRRGIAEADPSLDVDGWDAACKLVITANAVLGQSATLADVAVEGIRQVDHEMVSRALAEGQRMVLVCLAERSGQERAHYRLSVKPTPLPLAHPLARLTPDEMGVVYYSNEVDRLSAASEEPGAAPAAAAMLRDVIEIVRDETALPFRNHR